MTDDPSLDDEAIQNLYEQMYDLYLEDALAERGLDVDDMHAFQIVFMSPFKANQFEGLEGGDNAVEVRINNEVKASMRVTTTREIESGEEVRRSDIEEVTGIYVHDMGQDVGHVTFVWRGGELFTGFDFLYNAEYLDPLLEAADHFIELSEYARENELWRAFVENAFHAAERMMKARVIQHGDPAFKHALIEMNYSKYVEAGVGNPDLLAEYRQLHHNYRYAGSYVDPGTHPDGINEKEFKLAPDVADDILETIRDHRESINSSTI